MALVAAEKNYDIFLSSTPPNQIRFRILDADSNFKIRLSMYYFPPQRIDLYKDNAYIKPSNAEFSNGNMQLIDPTDKLDSFMPHYLNSTGTNFFYPKNRKIYFNIDGTTYIDLKLASVLFIR